MKTPVDDDDEASALALTPPPGLLVRRIAEAHGEAPFRRATTRATCEITFAAAAVSQAPAPLFTLAVAVVAAIAAVVGSLALEHRAWLVAVFAFVVFAPLVLVMSALPSFLAGAAPSAGPATLAIDADHVRLPSGGRLALADVRRIDVVRSGEAHAVQVVTPDGDVTIAAMALAGHARYIADEVGRAYRAHLRLRG